MLNSKDKFARRQTRTRYRVGKVAAGRPRLSVFRSSKHIYAQVIDDAEGRTIAAASTMEKGLRGDLKTGADVAAAKAVGKLIAERAAAARLDRHLEQRVAVLEEPASEHLIAASSEFFSNGDLFTVCRSAMAAPQKLNETSDSASALATWSASSTSTMCARSL